MKKIFIKISLIFLLIGFTYSNESQVTEVKNSTNSTNSNLNFTSIDENENSNSKNNLELEKDFQKIKEKFDLKYVNN